ncbi:MAG: hypothetical protein P1V97_33800 [Planctomycetota bacterium]|nr:hypothetical protein [Planctomycetota bacterium]
MTTETATYLLFGIPIILGLFSAFFMEDQNKASQALWKEIAE